MDHRKRRIAINTPGHAHALTFCVYRRQAYLLKRGAAEIFLSILNAARQNLNFDIWAYVVMPEHAHVLIHPRNETYSVAAILKAIKSPSAKGIFAEHPILREKCRVPGKDGQDEFRFWQAGGGYDRNIYTVKAAWSEISYIHNNPVKRGLRTLSGLSLSPGHSDRCFIHC